MKDHQFEKAIRAWILEFHGEVKPQTESAIDKRVESYIQQEDLYREKTNFVLSLLPYKPTLGLDVGSSAGGLSVALAQQGVVMEGIEPSQVGVEVSIMRARRLGLSNANFQRGVGESIPFSDNTFDVVVSLAVLEHVQNATAVVNETFRVLKPGGYAYFEVPNNLFPFECHYKILWVPMMPKRIAKLYVRLRGGYPEFLDGLNYMSRDIISRYFRNAGFTDIADVYGKFLSGKAAREPWSESPGRLAHIPFGKHAARLVFGPPPTALFLNRAVYLIARKPNQSES